MLIKQASDIVTVFYFHPAAGVEFHLSRHLRGFVIRSSMHCAAEKNVVCLISCVICLQFHILRVKAIKRAPRPRVRRLIVRTFTSSMTLSEYNRMWSDRAEQNSNNIEEKIPIRILISIGVCLLSYNFLPLVFETVEKKRVNDLTSWSRRLISSSFIPFLCSGLFLTKSSLFFSFALSSLLSVIIILRKMRI